MGCSVGMFVGTKLRIEVGILVSDTSDGFVDGNPLCSIVGISDSITDGESVGISEWNMEGPVLG